MRNGLFVFGLLILVLAVASQGAALAARGKGADGRAGSSTKVHSDWQLGQVNG